MGTNFHFNNDIMTLAVFNIIYLMIVKNSQTGLCNVVGKFSFHNHLTCEY